METIFSLLFTLICLHYVLYGHSNELMYIFRITICHLFKHITDLC